MLKSKIDFDKLLKIAFEEFESALKEWSIGKPASEEALMNHITGRLGRKRRGCNVGLEDEITSLTTTYQLHRKGPRQTDAFGSDIAVTISMPEISYMKTACFQIKIGHGSDAKIENRQINDEVLPIVKTKNGFF